MQDATRTELDLWADRISQAKISLGGAVGRPQFSGHLEAVKAVIIHSFRLAAQTMDALGLLGRELM